MVYLNVVYHHMKSRNLIRPGKVDLQFIVCTLQNKLLFYLNEYIEHKIDKMILRKLKMFLSSSLESTGFYKITVGSTKSYLLLKSITLTSS